METETLATTPITIEGAFGAIAEIRQRIAVMGANDSEFFLIGQIVDKLSNGDIGPTEAVKEAESILSGKQDYH